MRPHISTLPPGQSAYTNDGCRCDGCREGQRVAQAELRAWYYSHRDSLPVPHGTVGGYTNYGCRCDECRRANAEKARAYRAKKAAS